MAIALDHIILPVKDKNASASFFANIFGLRLEEPMGRFQPVKVSETLTLQFDESRRFEGRYHLAFHVSDEEFDGIFSQIKKGNLPFGSRALQPDNMAINRENGGRGLYFKDPDGHLLEILTQR